MEWKQKWKEGVTGWKERVNGRKRRPSSQAAGRGVVELWLRRTGSECMGLEEYALSEKPEYKRFDPDVMVVQPYHDQTFQPIYFVADCFEDAKSQLQKYALTIKKTFPLHYNPLTCSMEVLDSPQKVSEIATHLKEELATLCHVLEKLFVK